MRDRHLLTVEHVRRMADFARARTLAQRGLSAMAREIMRAYAPEEQPQIVAEVGVDVPRPREDR